MLTLQGSTGLRVRIPRTPTQPPIPGPIPCCNVWSGILHRAQQDADRMTQILGTGSGNTSTKVSFKSLDSWNSSIGPRGQIQHTVSDFLDSKYYYRFFESRKRLKCVKLRQPPPPSSLYCRSGRPGIGYLTTCMCRVGSEYSFGVQRHPKHVESTSAFSMNVLVCYKHNSGCSELGSMTLRQSPQEHDESLSSLNL